MNTHIQFNRTLLILTSLVASALILSCGNSTLTGVDTVNDQVLSIGDSQGIPTDQISWINWNAEALEQLNSLARKGHETKHIIADHGGHVGGGKTFDNKVDIPANALLEDTDVTVDVLCVENNQQCGAGVDFLPSMNFESNVEITLSFKYLNLDCDDDHEDDEDNDDDDGDDNDGGCNINFDLFFSQDGGNLWYPIGGNYEVDYHKQTISFWVDHFTRFAWGLGGNNDGDGGY